MKKMIVLFVMAWLSGSYVLQAQGEDSMVKGEAVAVQMMEGSIVEFYIESLVEVEDGFVETEGAATVFLQLTDATGNDYYFTGLSTQLNDLPDDPEALAGKRIQVVYTKTMVKEVVEYVPTKVAETMRPKGSNPQENITVYTLTGNQEEVVVTSEGLVVRLKTPTGTEMNLRVDEALFGEREPEEFNGQSVRVSYIEMEQFTLQSFQILDKE